MTRFAYVLILIAPFKTAAKPGSGCQRCSLHVLRHTYAVNSLRAGDDIKTVQENLGYATAAFTLDFYGHCTDEMRLASANRMQAFISQRVNT